MADRTAKVRWLVSVAGDSFSRSPGEESTVGASCDIGLEEASRYVSSGAAEWVEEKKETATRKAPERAAKRTQRGKP